ncbi:hypothetical protein [Methanosarcina horonobensis]|nr:hypothetical protein [Methanosarcina horonobensis]
MKNAKTLILAKLRQYFGGQMPTELSSHTKKTRSSHDGSRICTKHNG